MEKEEEDTLGEDLHGEVRDREWLDPKIAASSDLWRERRREQGRRREEEERPGRTGIGGRALASLTSYRVQRAP
jgi:hypothetical protein